MSNNKNILFLREEYGDGQGTFTSLEGDKYVGEFKDEKYHLLFRLSSSPSFT